MMLTRMLALGGWLVDALVVAFVVTILTCVAVPTFGPRLGHPVLVIQGASMAPAIPLGALAVLDPGDPADLHVGDVVSFLAPNGTTVTHRVVRLASLGAVPYIGTKGDANADADPMITPRSAIVGRVAWTVPGAGYLVTLLGAPIGRLALFLVTATLLVLALLLAELAAMRRAGARRDPRTSRRGPVAHGVAALYRGLRQRIGGLVGTVLVIGLMIAAGGSMLHSAAIFSASLDASGSTVTVGAWPPTDYRSVATGAWSAASTWQRFNGTAWVAAARPPESSDGLVTISSGNVVTADVDDDVAHLVVAAGGQLSVAGGVTLAVDSGAWAGIDIVGTVDVAGTMGLNAGATVSIESGGLLQDSGTITGAGSIVSNSGKVQAHAGARTIDLPISMSSAITVAGTDNLTLGGVISGSGSLTKSGTGTLTLSGANTYTGSTTVSAGVLDVQSSSALGGVGAAAVAANAALDLDGTGLSLADPLSLTGTGVATTGALRNLANGNTWTGPITLTGTTTLGSDGGTLTLGAIGAAAKNLTVTGVGNTTVGGVIATTSGSLTKAGTGTLTLSGANTYTGSTTVSAGVLDVQSSSALGGVGAAAVAANAALDLDGTGLSLADPLSLTGTGVATTGALRNLANGNTWTGPITLTGTTTLGSDGGTLTLGAIGAAAKNLTVTGVGNTTVGGVIATTSGSLTKAGTGTLTLSGANTYTGSTTVSAGVLALGLPNAIGASSATTVTATLDLGGFSETLASLAGTGTVTSSAAGAVTLTSGGNNTNTTFSGGVEDGSGQVALAKTGTGTLTLSGANTYSGTTTVSAGTLSINTDAALGTAPASPTAGQLTIGTATLATTGAFTLNANRGIALTAAATISPTAALTYNGVISGSGSLTKAGASSLTLSGANTYSGTTTVSAGTLSINTDAALGTAPASPTAGQLTIGTATLATTGAFTLNANRGIALTAAATISPTAALTYNGVISGSGSLTKSGTGTLTLSGANTYTGSTTVSAGVLDVQSSSALGGVGAAAVAANAALDLDGTGLSLADPLSLTGTGVATTGALRNLANGNTWAGPITLTGTTTVGSDGGTLTLGAIGAAAKNLTVTGVGNTTVGGVIATTSGSLTKSGTGTLTLSGANTYTGSTTVSAGVLDVQSSSALGGVGAAAVAANAALDLDGTGLSLADPLSLTGTGVATTGALRNLANGNTWAGPITLTGTTTVGSDGGTLTLGAIGAAAKNLTVTGVGNTTVGGVISGSGSLTKSGTGTLTLGGANTYTGSTTVSVGTLEVDGSTAAGAVTVAFGATLRGSGTIGGTVAVSGTLIPGGSPGLLVNGAVTLVSGATFSIEIGGTAVGTGYDQDRVASGAVTINSGVTLSLIDLNGFSPTVGQAFVILNKTAAGAITGTFSGLAEGSTVTNFLGGSLHGQISYIGGDGNDIVLTVTP